MNSTRLSLARLASACLFVAALTLPASTVRAACIMCPFCSAPSLTIAEQVDGSGHLLLAKWTGGEKPGEDSVGTSAFVVEKVGRSRDRTFTVGQEVSLPFYFAGKEDASYILMGPDTDLIDWQPPTEATDGVWKYMANLPMPETEPERQIERLAFFLDYLEHPDLTVANDAYAEFAAAPYEVIKPLSDQMPRKKLRDWVTDPETPVTRLGLYGLLLGLCGDAEDAKAMHQKIVNMNGDFRLGIEGVMSGYLIITGEAGLTELEDLRMKSTTYVDSKGEEVRLPFSEVYAAMQALRFMWTYEPDRIPKLRLKESMRNLLSRPELADLVIADLARWQDWGVQDQLMAMYDNEEFDIPSVKRAIVRYLFYCSQDRPEDGEDIPEHALTAEQHLKELEKKDPKNVRDAKRFLIR